MECGDVWECVWSVGMHGSVCGVWGCVGVCVECGDAWECVWSVGMCGSGLCDSPLALRTGTAPAVELMRLGSF